MSGSWAAPWLVLAGKVLNSDEDTGVAQKFMHMRRQLYARIGH
jgi:hypothetical protein